MELVDDIPCKCGDELIYLQKGSLSGETRTLSDPILNKIHCSGSSARSTCTGSKMDPKPFV